MKQKFLLMVLFLPVFLTGCSSGLLGSDSEVAPQKVTAKKTAPKKPVTEAKKSPQPKPGSGNATATYAIEDHKSQFKVESTLPMFQGELTTPPQQAPGQQNVLAVPSEQLASPVTAAAALAASGAGSAAAAAVQSAAVSPVTVPSLAAPAAAVPPLTVATIAPNLAITIEDAVIPAGTAPAVVALVNQADSSKNRGDLDGAVVNMERAMRIDARNPIITYKLAQLRLGQKKPQLAEDLAGKAALLAGSDLEMKRKSWLLIAEARQMQQNYQGAKDAKLKAESFFGR